MACKNHAANLNVTLTVTVLQIRGGNRDNLGIIVHFSTLKHIL